jgi:16S rRNA (uracil1498-N3)-methyltransferase
MHHQFALFFKNLSDSIKNLKKDQLFTIHDEEIVHRIVSVLRLQKDEEIILFDKKIHVFIILQDISKKNIQVLFKEKKETIDLKPKISFILPLLKKEALEESIYSLAEIGAQEIILAITEKSRQNLTEKELQRLDKILIAAAEQSKNFSMPQVIPPEYLADIAQKSEKQPIQKLFFDPQGSFINQSFANLTDKKDFILCIGPEGDLTEAEKNQLKKAAFNFISLTPTILRASQAVAIAAGLMRSWFRL